MYPYRSNADPPQSLANRLRSLNDSLQGLAARLKDTIAEAVGSTISQAIRDFVRRLLGNQNRRSQEETDSYRRFHDSPDRSRHRFDEDRDWHEREEDPWSDEEKQEWTAPSRPESSPRSSQRVPDAFRTAVQTALCWLHSQPFRRPVLSAVIVALATGGTALIAGPTLAAGVSVIASVASLVLTTDSVRSACGILTG